MFGLFCIKVLFELIDLLNLFSLFFLGGVEILIRFLKDCDFESQVFSGSWLVGLERVGDRLVSKQHS